GVPLVVIPVTGDQPLVAKRVNEVGAGIRLNRKELTSELLRESVKKVMNDVTFKENSRKVGESLRNAGGYINQSECCNNISIGCTNKELLSHYFCSK
ncbi:glycosyltransferase, partial [Bacillus sp. B-TM1]